MYFNLQRAKVYFFVLAVIMCLSLFGFTYQYTTGGGMLRTSIHGRSKLARSQNVSDTVHSPGSNPTLGHRGNLVDQMNVSNIEEAVRKFMSKEGVAVVWRPEKPGNADASEFNAQLEEKTSDIQKPNEIQTLLVDNNKSTIYVENSSESAENGVTQSVDHIEKIALENDKLASKLLAKETSAHSNVNISSAKPNNDTGNKDSPSVSATKLGKHFTVHSQNDLLSLNARNIQRKTGLNQHIKNRLMHMGHIGDEFERNHHHLAEGVTSRPDDCAGCFKSNFRSLIEAPNLCPPSESSDLLILITSVAGNVEARATIRTTWGSVCNRPGTNIKCVFIFGNNNNAADNTILTKESEKHHDIYQADFVDTYANLTYKTMTGFRWMQNHCKNVKFVMKTDDDVYLNTDLLPVLLKAAPEKGFMGGTCWGRSPPHRDTSSKWYVSFEQYEHPLFPQMCSGTGYIVSRDVAIGVVQTSSDIPFFYLEDVYVAIIVNRLGVHPVAVKGFSNVPVDFEPCKFRNEILLCHAYNPSALQDVWRKSRKCERKELTPKILYDVRRV